MARSAAREDRQRDLGVEVASTQGSGQRVHLDMLGPNGRRCRASSSVTTNKPDQSARDAALAAQELGYPQSQ
ncbi:hypothetical protein DB30_02781 [Enhygromyxa salina]|uniref:Uncharacterized protein n=1 Tax=Enhygromyxa salina TaxID=215803 RepID=A0A0C2A305_9BACT|nr:hypothetical protein DB30_02781 [Enhygromyxa salina]